MRPYENYEKILPRILSMLEKYSSSDKLASDYWVEEIQGFDYMFNATPEIINKLREHCYHITGIHSYGYRKHHSHKMEPFKRKLEILKSMDKDSLFIPENTQLGGFGHDVEGELVNLDTLKFYETALAINSINEFFVKNKHSKLLAVEIGGGWGGFGHVFKELVPNATYVIIDLPQTLLFSSVYLSSLYPDKNIYVYSEYDFDSIKTDLHKFDFVFLPSDIITDFNFDHIDIAINMISFQEMTSDQVIEYLDWLKMSNTSLLYSHNRGKSPHNYQLSDVHDLIEKYYNLHNIEMLEVPYTVLSAPKKSEKKPQPLGKKAKLRKIFTSLINQLIQVETQSEKVIPQKAINKVDYRHIYATKT